MQFTPAQRTMVLLESLAQLSIEQLAQEFHKAVEQGDEDLQIVLAHEQEARRSQDEARYVKQQAQMRTQPGRVQRPAIRSRRA
jgi:hypothetical protein